jgi:hypothetical protein
VRTEGKAAPQLLTDGTQRLGEERRLNENKHLLLAAIIPNNIHAGGRASACLDKRVSILG